MQPADLRPGVPSEELALHRAVPQHPDPVAQGVELGELVADVEQGGAVRDQLPQQVEQSPGLLGGQRRGRLVEDEDLRFRESARASTSSCRSDTPSSPTGDRIDRPGQLQTERGRHLARRRCSARRRENHGDDDRELRRSRARFSATVMSSTTPSLGFWCTVPTPRRTAASGSANVTWCHR